MLSVAEIGLFSVAETGFSSRNWHVFGSKDCFLKPFSASETSLYHRKQKLSVKGAEGGLFRWQLEDAAEARPRESSRIPTPGACLAAASHCLAAAQGAEYPWQGL